MRQIENTIGPTAIENSSQQTSSTLLHEEGAAFACGLPGVEGFEEFRLFGKVFDGFGDWFCKRRRVFLDDVLLCFVAFGLLEAFWGMVGKFGHKTTVFLLLVIG